VLGLARAVLVSSAVLPQIIFCFRPGVLGTGQLQDADGRVELAGQALEQVVPLEVLADLLFRSVLFDVGVQLLLHRVVVVQVFGISQFPAFQLGALVVETRVRLLGVQLADLADQPFHPAFGNSRYFSAIERAKRIRNYGPKLPPDFGVEVVILWRGVVIGIVTAALCVDRLTSQASAVAIGPVPQRANPVVEGINAMKPLAESREGSRFVVVVVIGVISGFLAGLVAFGRHEQNRAWASSALGS